MVLAVPLLLPLVAMLPLLVNPVPLEVHTRASELALVVLQVSVYDCPAVMVDGVRWTLMVGAGVGGGAGAVVMVSVYVAAVVPLAPVAVQVHVDG